MLDDYLRLMFVEYEPTWEWRFIKEVFHRDPLVGMKGFRTFLYSSDPQVRQQNELFLPSMTPPREEFFKNDLIFLGDMPSGPPSRRRERSLLQNGQGVCRRHGRRIGNPLRPPIRPAAPGQDAAGRPVAGLRRSAGRFETRNLSKSSLRPKRRRIPSCNSFAGSSLTEMQRAWDNLGPLPWYQPVEGIHASATVLAEHPTATCANGRKQPLIAIRQYGRGEVVYLGFDETWRLRRIHGEELYRKFWKEVMWRLALNHALGANKRFVVQTDQQRYQVDQTVSVTVNAGDAQYKALSESRRCLAANSPASGSFPQSAHGSPSCSRSA